MYLSVNFNYMKHLLIMFYLLMDILMHFVIIRLIHMPTCNKPPLDTNKFARQCNKCTLTTSWILRSDFIEEVNPQKVQKKYRNLGTLYRICIHMRPFPVYIDRPHFCNKEVVSVGTHLNVFYLWFMLSIFVFVFTDCRRYISLTHVH
jgi:hypothetical protein